ncbi:hypothetical protein BVC71_01505 [Marivivens niveibacter]|uniref:SH3b domain-containing protein n=1 Tax=Marivivens niveibacter TaxID=1930667 RepID=A0A251X0V3_9RHOB|nr:DUF1236 domain-containing protein [Marivivens niveibacter]OUD10216.1 hypothetical protein BVC71_01505 [Marivivens niveibacter]
MKPIKTALMGSAIALMAAAPATAQSLSATAATDLNVRSGPGAWYEPVTVIPGGEMAMVDGCLSNAEWCEVTYDGVQGWSYAPYLTINEGEEFVTLPQATVTTVETIEMVDVEATEAEETGAGLAGGAVGALIAYGLGGPVGVIAATGMMGAAAGAATVEPTTETITYIETNPVEAVWLNGEVVVGAGIPETVTTYDTPEVAFDYLNVNGQTVVIDAETNVIVDVIG